MGILTGGVGVGSGMAFGDQVDKHILWNIDRAVVGFDGRRRLVLDEIGNGRNDG